MKAYKALNKDMTCQGFQYAEGESYELPEGQEAKLCERGFHACERAVDVLDYYPASGSVIHEVEVDDVDPKREGDTKLAARKIRIGARLNVGQLVQATFEYNRVHCTEERTDPKQASAGAWGAASAGERGAASAGAWGAASAGERGAASAGESGAASAGESGAASAGERGAASAGERGAAVSRGTAEVGETGIAAARGNRCRVRGGLGSVLVIAEEYPDNYNIAAWKAIVVDGETVKADTWYKLEDGELVEVTDDA